MIRELTRADKALYRAKEAVLCAKLNGDEQEVAILAKAYEDLERIKKHFINSLTCE